MSPQLPIKLCGWMGCTSRTKKTVVRVLKKAIPLVFKDTDLKKIKGIKVVFMKHEADWQYGFNWLISDNYIQICVSRGFLRPFAARFLSVHELIHARQIIRKQLKVSYKHNVVYFKGKKYNNKAKNKNKDGFRYTPWETEAMNIHMKLDDIYRII